MTTIEITDPGLRLAKLWYLAGFLSLVLVGVLSLMPLPDIDIGVGDKLSHLFTYALLTGWFSLLARRRISLLWTIAGIIAFGMLIELLQGMTGYRYAEWGDVLANGVGAAAGALVYFSPLPRLLRFVDARLALLLLRH